MEQHILRITGDTTIAANGFFVECGFLPSRVILLNETSDVEVKVALKKGADAEAFVNPGIKTDPAGGSGDEVTVLTNGLAVWKGVESETAGEPAEFHENTDGDLKYFDYAGTQISTQPTVFDLQGNEPVDSRAKGRLSQGFYVHSDLVTDEQVLNLTIVE